MNVRDMEVRRVSRLDCQKFIFDIHYAQRWPSVSYAFGLFGDDILEGVVTYGTPMSSTLKKGLAGDKYEGSVIELNRLVLQKNRPNEASFLVGRSLRELGRIGNFIVVSYADTEQGHAGFVYQATNFSYRGMSAPFVDVMVEGMEHLHHSSIGDKFKEHPNRREAMREYYGDRLYEVERSRKHRYVTVVGDRKFKRAAFASISYPEEPYPKQGGERPTRVVKERYDRSEPLLL